MAPPSFPADIPVMPLARISPAKLAAGDLEESQRLFDASVQEGFFQLDLRHGLDAGLLANVDRAFEASKQYFAQDLDVKKQQTPMRPGNIGYKPQGTMKLQDGRTDLTEICAVARDDILEPTRQKDLPALWAQHVELLTALNNALHELAFLILRRLVEHLDIPPEALLGPHDVSKDSTTVLRFLHNPPQQQGDKQTSLLGHTDSGSLTLLFTRIGGLQVLPADAADEDESAWRWVKPEEGCVVVNIADVLVQWTGGVLRSAYHRVLHAPGEQANEDRYSFGYFLKPHLDADMRVIRQGSVIRHGVDEGPQPPYKEWQNLKTKNINAGTNSRGKGGLGTKKEVAASA